MKLENYRKYAPSIVRISMSLVFLWFSINQFISPMIFTAYIPGEIETFFSFIPNALVLFVYANAVFELIAGTMLLFGYFTRINAFLLSIHLFFISLSLGYGQTMIRDLGLTIATFSIFINGPDELCRQK